MLTGGESDSLTQPHTRCNSIFSLVIQGQLFVTRLIGHLGGPYLSTLPLVENLHKKTPTGIPKSVKPTTQIIEVLGLCLDCHDKVKANGIYIISPSC